MFSSKNFIISTLTFGSLIHFVLIFIYCVREAFNFILLLMAIQLTRAICQKDYSFPIESLGTLVENQTQF